MYSTERRKLAIEAYIKFDLSAADTIAELGYPTRHSLGAWCKDYLEHGEVRPPKRQREPKFTLEMRRAAVDYHLAHGRSLARTMRRMGYPAGREYLCDWIDELAPGRGNTGGRIRRRTPSRLRRRHRRWPSSSPAAEVLLSRGSPGARRARAAPSRAASSPLAACPAAPLCRPAGRRAPARGSAFLLGAPDIIAHYLPAPYVGHRARHAVPGGEKARAPTRSC